jgi:hypothetical protein
VGGYTVNVGSFATALDAHFAQDLLEQRGIPCFVVGEMTGTAWGFSMGVAEGIRLSVREEDVDAASAVLEELSHAEVVPGEDAAVSAPADSESAEPKVSDEVRWAKRMRAAAVLLIPAALGAHLFLGILGKFLPLLVIGFLWTHRAREEPSPEARHYLNDAWVAIALAILLQVGLAVAHWARRP